MDITLIPETDLAVLALLQKELIEEESDIEKMAKRLPIPVPSPKPQSAALFASATRNSSFAIISHRSASSSGSEETRQLSSERAL